MPTIWTKITKASGTSWTEIPRPPTATTIGGSPIGLLMALTYASGGAQWTKITKASGTSWTNITKAT